MSIADKFKTNKFRDTWRDIVKNAKLGMSHQRAAEAEGVSVSTLYKWIARAKRASYPEDEEYVQFYDELKKANARAERKMAKHLKDAAEFDWKAALEWLRARNPGDWGKRVDVEEAWEITVRELGLDPEEVLHEVVSILTEKHSELGEDDPDSGGEGED